MATLLIEQEANHTKERELKIIEFVQTYKITEVHAVKRRFFPVYIEPDHRRGYDLALKTLESLSAEGRLERVKGRSEFAKNVFVTPGHRIKEDADLARLWFCCLGRERRHLVAYEDISALFAAEGLKPPYHNYAHAICDVEGGPVVCRLYLCLAEKMNAREQLLQHIGQKAKAFRHWIDAGSYGIAVLVQSDQKKKEIKKLLQTSYAGRAPLCEQARFIVETVPTVQTFPQFIKQHVSEVWK